MSYNSLYQDLEDYKARDPEGVVLVVTSGAISWRGKIATVRWGSVTLRDAECIGAVEMTPFLLGEESRVVDRVSLALNSAIAVIPQ